MVTEKQMTQLFSKCGKVSSVRILPHKYCAFVNYNDPQCAVAAMEKLQVWNGVVYFVKMVWILSLSGPYCLVFGLNTEICSVNRHIQSKYGKIGPEKLRIQILFTQCLLLFLFRLREILPSSMEDYILKTFSFYF